MFQSHKAAELSSLGHVILALESRIQERVVESPSVTKESCLGQVSARVFLHGGLERPLHGSVKVKLVLCWRPQDVGNARVVGYVPRKTAKSG